MSNFIQKKVFQWNCPLIYTGGWYENMKNNGAREQGEGTEDYNVRATRVAIKVWDIRTESLSNPIHYPCFILTLIFYVSIHLSFLCWIDKHHTPNQTIGIFIYKKASIFSYICFSSPFLFVLFRTFYFFLASSVS